MRKFVLAAVAVAVLAFLPVDFEIEAQSTAQTLSAVDASVKESAGQWCQTVTRAGSTSGSSSFNYTTVNGSAKSPGDYAAKIGRQTIRSGTSKITFCGALVNDTLVEGQETFRIVLTSVSGSVIAKNTGTQTILDDDFPAPTWKPCALENERCYIAGPDPATVRYGAGTTWVLKQVTGSVVCSNGVFGDPLPNVLKTCQTTGTMGSPPPPDPVPDPIPTDPLPTGWIAGAWPTGPEAWNIVGPEYFARVKVACTSQYPYDVYTDAAGELQALYRTFAAGSVHKVLVKGYGYGGGKGAPYLTEWAIYPLNMPAGWGYLPETCLEPVRPAP